MCWSVCLSHGLPACTRLCAFQPVFSFLAVLLLACSGCLPHRRPCKEGLSLTSPQAAPLGVLDGGRAWLSFGNLVP